MRRILIQSSPLAGLACLLLGCAPAAPPAPAPAPTPPAATSSTATNADAHGHAHGAGPHDGTLADWGGGKYHVEFTVDHDKQEATVYVVGSDEKSASPIKATDGKIHLSIADPEIEVDLMAAPEADDPDGASSRFVGTHENLGIVQEYAGTISGEVDGTPYSGDFKEEPHGHEEAAAEEGGAEDAAE